MRLYGCLRVHVFLKHSTATFTHLLINVESVDAHVKWMNQ